MSKYREVWKYWVMMGKYEEVWKYQMQILKWVIMVAMSAQMYHDLPHHLDHDLTDKLYLPLYLEWDAYELNWITPEV